MLKQLKTVSNVFNTTYYMLASTRHAKEGCFIFETSNLSGWSKHAQKEWDIKAHFETYSQAKDVHNEVNKVAQRHLHQRDSMSADEIKKSLRHRLNDLLGMYSQPIGSSGFLSDMMGYYYQQMQS